MEMEITQMMTPRPRVTVWIPSYNHARYLPEAIESVLHQSFQDLELLIVDDGSQDESLSIAKSYQAQHPEKIRVATHPGHVNKGISATVNLATELARGHFFCALPSDDRLPLDSVEVRLRRLEPISHGSFVYGQAAMFDSDRPESLRIWSDDITHVEEPVTAFFSRNPIPGMTVMASRDAWLSTGDHDPQLHFSDWDFWLRMATKWKPVFIPSVLAYHRLTGRNATYLNGWQGGIRNSLDVLLAAKWKLPKLSQVLQEPSNMALLERQCALHHLKLGQMNDAKNCLARAIEADPLTTCHPHFVEQWMGSRRHLSEVDRPESIVELANAFSQVDCRRLGATKNRRLHQMLLRYQIDELCCDGCRKECWKTARTIAWQCVTRNLVGALSPHVFRSLCKALLGAEVVTLQRRARRMAKGLFSQGQG
jgi:alpha-1,3-rhamnosyltransferase